MPCKCARRRITTASVPIPSQCTVRVRWKAKGPDMELVLDATVAACLAVYLFWTLLRPEDF